MSNDDILNARIRRNLRSKDWSLPREDLEKRIMNRIMKILMSFQNEGMFHNQLAEYIEIDRKTLRRYMKRLIEMHLVTREPGKHGKYYPTTKRHRGTSISAEILAESFKERFLAPLNEKFREEFVLDSPHFKRLMPSSEFELEDALFNFSNIVGGWITYILIQSINPANKLTAHIKDTTEKNLIIQSWTEDAISLIQPYLLSFFNYYIYPSLKTLYKRVSNRRGGFNNQENENEVFFDFLFRRQFLLDDEIACELNDAFSNLYPNLSCELEKTRAELPILVKHEIDEMNRYAEKIRRQKLCKLHEFILEDDYDKYRILKCKRCEKRKREEKIN
jgi:DNA-binding MarR family transcriptional regulator